MVADYLTGKIDEEAFLAETLDGDGKPMPSLQCEANFFIGQKKLMADDAAGAREAFEKAVATNRHGMAAHRGARLALQAK
jgi:lipoprotein NlpI